MTRQNQILMNGGSNEDILLANLIEDIARGRYG